MKNKRGNLAGICLATFSAAAFISAPAIKAASFTAAATGSWSSGATWGNSGNNTVGSGVPGPSDSALIASGKTVTYDNSAPATVGPVEVAGSIVISKSGGTFGDFQIDSSGTLSFGSQVPVTFSGNFTNNGSMNVSGQSQTALTTYSGTGKVIAGNVTNQIVNVTGTYTNTGTLVTGANATGGVNLEGSGTLVNQGTIIYNCNQAPTISTLDCTTPGNLFRWAGINMSSTTPKGTAYYDLILGNTGSAGFPLGTAGLSIADNLLVTNAGNISSWPANNTIGGTLTYSTTSTTAANFPAAFSVGGFVQSSGVLAMPASSTLTVTGTGVEAWYRTGGTLNQNSSSTVKFTGAAPVIGGAITNGFANLYIDSTALDAVAATNFNVTNALTVAPGALLDVTAFNGGAMTMLGTESLLNSGTLAGNVTAPSTAKIFAGLDGSYGTNTILGNLTMSSTNSSINLDVNSAAAAANDLLVVQGTLSLNNTPINLKAPSAGAAIDTSTDYTLVTAGGITGVPVMNWVTAPANGTNYSLVTTSTSIKLHYGGSSVISSPTLNSVVNGNQITFSWDTVNHPGFFLQTSPTVGPGVWTAVPGGNSSPVIITINPNTNAFFRLSH